MEADKELQMGEYDRVDSPEVISSGGLGPCIAIGIYDRKEQIGYMIHQDNPCHNEDNISEFLKMVFNTSEKENLKVHVAGGQIDPKDDDDDEYTDGNEDEIESRNYVLQLLRKLFNKNQIKIDWNNDSLATVVLCLDTGKGKFKVSSINYNEYL